MTRKTATKPRKFASQERSRATVAALVEATARVLVSEGFDKASTNRIAEVAGVSVGSLYQYFPSKEALVLAVAGRHNRDIMQVVGGVIEEIDSLPLEEAVRRLIGVAIAAHRVNPRLHCVLTEQVPFSGRLEDVDAARRRAYDAFSSYLEKRRDQLGVTDLSLAAFMCATSIEALAHNTVLHSGVELSDEMIETLINETSHLIVGYLKRSH